MGFCTKCGSKLLDGASFCQMCGAKVAVKMPVETEVAAETIAPAVIVEEKSEAVEAEAEVEVEAEVEAEPVVNEQQLEETEPVITSQPKMEYQLQQNYVQRPAYMLATNRSLAKYFWLSVITFGIYGIVTMSKISSDINILAWKNDGKRTMHYCLVVFIFSWLTVGILPLVWYTKLSNRIGNELRVREINYSFSAKHFWLWKVLGSLIICGPFIYYHKLMTAMNLISNDYNIKGF